MCPTYHAPHRSMFVSKCSTHTVIFLSVFFIDRQKLSFYQSVLHRQTKTNSLSKHSIKQTLANVYQSVLHKQTDSFLPKHSSQTDISLTFLSKHSTDRNITLYQSVLHRQTEKSNFLTKRSSQTDISFNFFTKTVHIDRQMSNIASKRA